MLNEDLRVRQNGVGRIPAVVVRDLSKTYWLGETEVQALRSVSLKIAQGEFVAVMGPSGSGKSTFMNLIGCLDHPTAGEYWLDGVPVAQLNADELAAVRNQRIGFVFQGFNLLARESALENVMLPLMYAGLPRREQELRAYQALRLVGLEQRIHHRQTQLSGGQQQRVAIARALVNWPTLLLADEPTGNLDSQTGLEILALLQALNRNGITIILVTHNDEIALYARRQVLFRDGRLVEDKPLSTATLLRDKQVVESEGTPAESEFDADGEERDAHS